MIDFRDLVAAMEKVKTLVFLGYFVFLIVRLIWVLPVDSDRSVILAIFFLRLADHSFGPRLASILERM
jgi:hypothetical protein